jgi:hypothetical protein
MAEVANLHSGIDRSRPTCTHINPTKYADLRCMEADRNRTSSAIYDETGTYIADNTMMH